MSKILVKGAEVLPGDVVSELAVQDKGDEYPANDPSRWAPDPEDFGSVVRFPRTAKPHPENGGGAPGGPRGFILRSTPDLFDLTAWRARLKELEEDPESPGRDGLIEVARAHIAALEEGERLRPSETR